MDPDGRTFWVFNAYGQQNNIWGTWLGAFQCADNPQVTVAASIADGNTPCPAWLAFRRSLKIFLHLQQNTLSAFACNPIESEATFAQVK